MASTRNEDHIIKVEIILDIHMHVGRIYNAHYFHPHCFSSQKDINQKQLKTHHAFASLKDLKVFWMQKTKSHCNSCGTECISLYRCVSLQHIIQSDQCLSGLCLY